MGLCKQTKTGTRSRIPPPHPLIAWKQEDEKAKSYISIGDVELKQVRYCSIAHEIWLKLKSIFESKGFAKKISLWKRLLTHRLDMATYNDTSTNFWDDQQIIRVIRRGQHRNNHCANNANKYCYIIYYQIALRMRSSQEIHSLNIWKLKFLTKA